jgi:xanthine dehydrogenase accessory factor
VAGFFAEVHSLLVAGAPGYLVLGLRREGDAVVPVRALFSGERLVAALPAEGCPVPEEILRAVPHAPILIERGAWRYFLEPLAPPITVVVCGAGHIAAQLVPLCHLLGFRTIVVDDRAEFANPTRFPMASRLLVAPSLDRALDGLALGRDAYVVIVTRGHAGDLAVLRQALRGQPGYIGMIGSRRKREVVFEALATDVGPTILPGSSAPSGCPSGRRRRKRSPSALWQS